MSTLVYLGNGKYATAVVNPDGSEISGGAGGGGTLTLVPEGDVDATRASLPVGKYDAGANAVSAIAPENPLDTENNVSFYAEDSVTAHGRRLLPINVNVTADNQEIVAAPGAANLIRLYRLNVQLRAGGAACEAGTSFTTAGASLHDSVLTAAGQPGGFNAAPNYLQGGLNEGLFAVLSGASSVKYTGLYEVIDPSTEVLP